MNGQPELSEYFFGMTCVFSVKDKGFKTSKTVKFICSEMANHGWMEVMDGYIHTDDI